MVHLVLEIDTIVNPMNVMAFAETVAFVAVAGCVVVAVEVVVFDVATVVPSAGASS